MNNKIKINSGIKNHKDLGIITHLCKIPATNGLYNSFTYGTCCKKTKRFNETSQNSRNSSQQVSLHYLDCKVLGKQTINALQRALGAVLLQDGVLLVLAARTVLHTGKHLAQD